MFTFLSKQMNQKFLLNIFQRRVNQKDNIFKTKYESNKIYREI